MIRSAIVLILGLLVSGTANAQSGYINFIKNGDFEDNSASQKGPNIITSLPHWTIGTGYPNVDPMIIRVDGPGGFDETGIGPSNDASGTPATAVQHYLYSGWQNVKISQTFTPQCSGTLEFGFSVIEVGETLFPYNPFHGNVYVSPVNGSSVGPHKHVSVTTLNWPQDEYRSHWVRAQDTLQVVGGEDYALILHFQDGTIFDSVWARMPLSVNCAGEPIKDVIDYIDFSGPIDEEPPCDEGQQIVLSTSGHGLQVIVLPCLIYEMAHPHSIFSVTVESLIGDEITPLPLFVEQEGCEQTDELSAQCAATDNKLLIHLPETDRIKDHQARLCFKPSEKTERNPDAAPVCRDLSLKH